MWSISPFKGLLEGIKTARVPSKGTTIFFMMDSDPVFLCEKKPREKETQNLDKIGEFFAGGSWCPDWSDEGCEKWSDDDGGRINIWQNQKLRLTPSCIGDPYM